MNDPRVTELRSLLQQAMVPDWVRLGARAVRLFKDRLHPDKHDPILNRLLEQARASVALRERRRISVPRVTYPADLPITARKDDIVAAIRANQVVVLAGETGSGKTTQIPKMCLEAGLGIEAKIGCTQPRRVAALSISKRIAEELNVGWGREVGCKIRFDDRSSSETYIKLMTDGILLAETQGDPDLSEYNAIIIDEAHERSLNIDFLLGYLKNLLARRKDLKLVVTSATIDTQAFSKHFGNAPIIEVSGRMFPVDLVYAPFEHEPDSEEEAEGKAGILPALSEERSKQGMQGQAGSPPYLAASPETPRLAASIRASLRAGSSDGDTLTYADAAVRAADTILYDTDAGDLLIFMPGERDIREIADQLEGRFGGAAEIVPLFGRLSSGDQQRVFSPTTSRKVVIATNIAETSLTIPGIRYVIDAGLARISRYNPRTRTKRLPVEPVSQSSANQRKGRAGRVQDGVCIRLYSEEDFKDRPPFTQPEIQRANLAEVILRMKAFQLGDIETFPFVQPPAPNAITNGYGLLQELGALDAERAVTPLGWDLARLPIDPTLGRMLVESGREGVSRELLIIASGLSIQDPRERPLDQRDAAAAAHRKFTDPQSDFLTLLNVWNAVHDQWESLRTQGARRKFCKQHFLSYLRMREWQDLHGQLEDALEDVVGRASSPGQKVLLHRAETLANRKPPTTHLPGGDARPTGQPVPPTDKVGRVALRPGVESQRDSTHPLYAPIHRSILSGLLGHVSRREERNSYKGSGNRLLTMFPGSALFERGEPQRKFSPDRRERSSEAKPSEKSKQPLWIVAGEIVETSQLFARTLAGIDPQWIAELAPHLCKRTHVNPHWSAAAGRVLCDEVFTLHGMEITRRKVSYGNVDAKDATKIFIRSALVEGDLLPSRSRRGDEAEDEDSPDEVARLLTSSATNQYPFLAHNRSIRQKIESWQTRVRRYDIGDLDELLCGFYGKRLENISSRDELNRWLREPSHGDSLKAAQADLIGDRQINFDSDAFPDAVQFDDRSVSLSYAYAPGEEWDGVTLRLPADLAKSLTSADIEWAVPGLRAEQVEELLRSLPKTLRRELMPLQEKVAEIIRDFRPTGESLRNDLGRFIHQRYGVAVPATAWSEAAIPAHLRPRVEVVARDGRKLASGRDLDALRGQLEEVKDIPAAEPPIWRKARQQWEKPAVTGWTFGDLPERVLVGDHRGQTIHAWPGLKLEDGNAVSVRLFRSAEEARDASVDGGRALIERALQKEFAWLRKDLKALEKTGWGGGEELQDSALELLKTTAFPKENLQTMTQAAFDSAVQRTREQLRLLTPKLVEQLGAILLLRQKIEKGWEATAPVPAQKQRTLNDLSQLGQTPRPVAKPGAKPTSVFAAELAALLPPRFPEQLTVERLPHLQRYLKALQIRCARAAQNPLKEQERVRIVAPYAAALAAFTGKPPKTAEGRKAVDDFRWMVEELRVSVFAQEVGTAFPVSPKRLDEELEKIRRLA